RTRSLLRSSVLSGPGMSLPVVRASKGALAVALSMGLGVLSACQTADEGRTDDVDLTSGPGNAPTSGSSGGSAPDHSQPGSGAGSGPVSPHPGPEKRITCYCEGWYRWDGEAGKHFEQGLYLYFPNEGLPGASLYGAYSQYFPVQVSAS